MVGHTSSVSRRWLAVALVVPTMTVAVVLTLLGPTVASKGPIAVTLLPALLLFFYMLVGPYGVAGTALGCLGYQLTHGGVSPWIIAGVLTFGLVITLLQFDFDTTLARETDTLLSARSVRRFVATMALASVSAGSVTAWGFDLSNQFRFFPTSVFLVIEWFVSAVPFGGVVLFLLTRSTTARRLRSRDDPNQEPLLPAKAKRRWPVELLLIPAGWFVFGNLLSVGFQLIERVPPVVLRSRGLGWILLFEDPVLFGPGGETFQLTLGTVCLVWLSVVSWRWKISTEIS